MKRVLYIYGCNSSENSETRANLQEVLGPDIIVDSVHYEQCQPNEAMEYLGIIAQSYDAIIGSSLGGFYVLKIDFGGPKIVINPCMMPSVELPKIGCSKGIANRFAPYQTYRRNDVLTFGFFGNHDELIDYREKFINEVSCNAAIFNSGHHPTLTELKVIGKTMRNIII